MWEAGGMPLSPPVPLARPPPPLPPWVSGYPYVRAASLERHRAIGASLSFWDRASASAGSPPLVSALGRPPALLGPAG